MRNNPTVQDVELERDFERIGSRTMLLNARRIEEDGQSGSILLALEDVTERKRAAEARYRRLFEAAKDGILIADADTGEIMDLNPSLESLAGYPREELLGKKLWGFEPLTGNPEVEPALERIRHQEKVHLPDLLLKAKSGRAIHVEAVANEYSEGSRRVVQFNLRDITERKRFKRKLQHTQKLESLGLLAGGIAHDFNNLLTGIIGNASLGLMEPPNSPQNHRYFREIASASQKAADLTRQMLAYAGKGRFVVERIDVSQLVKEIEPLIHTSIPKMVAIQLDLESGLPAVEADPAQVQQLVMNLIINGAEAIGEGESGTVVVRTETRDLNAEDIQREFRSMTALCPENTSSSRFGTPAPEWMRRRRPGSSIPSLQRNSRAEAWGWLRRQVLCEVTKELSACILALAEGHRSRCCCRRWRLNLPILLAAAS